MHWKVGRQLLVVTLIANIILLPMARGADQFGHMIQAITASMSREKPAMSKSPSVESFAKQVDWLEHRLETYGSVISKRPDIWGQARLTQHREQYEKLMYAELDQFNETLQGSIRRSDQSFMALAFSLNAATGTETKPPTSNAAQALIFPGLPGASPTSADPIVRSATTATSNTNPLGNFGDNVKFSLEPTIVRAQQSRYLNYVNHLRRINEGDDTSDAPGYALYLARLPVSVLPGKHTESGYGAEITYTATPQLTSELLPLTFRNLVINDLVDQLSLIVTKILDDREAMPKLRSFMGIYTSIDWNMVEALREELRNSKHPHNRNYTKIRNEIQQTVRAQYPADQFDITTANGKLWNDALGHLIDDVIAEHERLDAAEKYYQSRPDLIKPEDPSRAWRLQEVEQAAMRQPAQMLPASLRKGSQPLELVSMPRSAAMLPFSTQIRDREFFQNSSSIQSILRDLRQNIGPNAPQSLASSSLVRNRNRSMAFPASQNADVFGEMHVLSHLVLAIDGQLRTDLVNGRQIQLPDVRAMLFDELSSAYDFLSLPESLHLWQLCGPTLADAIRDRRREMRLPTGFYEAPPEYVPDPTYERTIRRIRSEFFAAIKREHTRSRWTATTSLGWCILCEASLLNQALIDDMGRVATEKGCVSLRGVEAKFYLPRPLPLNPQVHLPLQPSTYTEFNGPNPFLRSRNEVAESLQLQYAQKTRATYDQHVADLQVASEVFCDYVRCRWPVTVFALDPMNDEQNIADSFSRRREMQLAVAVAVADGKVSPNAAGRFVRRLETDIETIALNRTAVGFSHGNDTFGWRYYPRVQTPPFQRNLAVIGESILGPNPNQDIRTRKLEPGIRDCYAIIIMPSFVPHCTFTSRSNWFCLTNASHKELSIADAMQLSKAYQSVVNFSQQARDCGEYRPGDVSHIMSVVEQIGKRLPFQNELVQVPYENTVGGFELFTSGITDLGPELIGFYGAPGVDVEFTPSEPPATGTTVTKFTAQQSAIPFDPQINLDPTLNATTVKGTTLFIVGKHFSVTNTKFIAGGRYVPFRLLSREIAEVMIPPNVNLINNDAPGARTAQFVDVHIATPYGVSNHLLIPAHRPSANAPTSLEERVKKLEAGQVSVKPTEVSAAFKKFKDNGEIDTMGMAISQPLEITLDWALPANTTSLIPNKAMIVMQPLKETGSFIAKDDAVLLQVKKPKSVKEPMKPDEFETQLDVDKGKKTIKVPEDFLKSGIEQILEKNKANRLPAGTQTEFVFSAELYVRTDTDSRFMKVDQKLTIKLKHMPDPCTCPPAANPMPTAAPAGATPAAQAIPMSTRPTTPPPLPAPVPAPMPAPPMNASPPADPATPAAGRLEALPLTPPQAAQRLVPPAYPVTVPYEISQQPKYVQPASHNLPRPANVGPAIVDLPRATMRPGATPQPVQLQALPMPPR